MEIFRILCTHPASRWLHTGRWWDDVAVGRRAEGAADAPARCLRQRIRHSRGTYGRRSGLRTQSQRPRARSRHVGRVRRRPHDLPAHRHPVAHGGHRTLALPDREPAPLDRARRRHRRHRRPARLGHPQRLHAARRRRVRLQLAHPAPRHRPRRGVRQHPRHLLLELVHRHVARRAGAAALRPVHGLVGLRRLGRPPRPGLFVLGIDRRRRRLPLRRLRHEDLLADPEDPAHPRHRRPDRAHRRAVPLEQGRLHRQLERDRRRVQVRSTTRRSSRRPGRCPTRGIGTARSAPSAASTRCSCTTTRSPT